MRPTMRRRSLLVGTLAAAPLLVRAQASKPVALPLRFGADVALADAGLAGALQHAFGRDTGLAVQLIRTPALPLLEALGEGELDVALTNVPGAETRLESEGLAYDRRAVATGRFVLVGPTARHGDSGGPARGHDVAAALKWWREAGTDARAQPFLSANDGSGVHLAEQAAWRLAGLAPAPPWYRVAAAGTALVTDARKQGAYALVEAGVWAREGGAPLSVLVDGDERLDERVHVMRSFRSMHPAAKLFVGWITGSRGRSVVAAQRGYRVPAG